ncbi:TetR family transcriptional regulator [Pseudomonas sp. NCCP-436]|nr:TetR family transcriptional regulator [Pseudomonas sp. NCCP-436]
MSPNAAEAAYAVAERVHYQGRKTSRQGSEQRRQTILEAVMRIIVRDGVRAVRHRAVAAEAQVPLSATTYYFKDIDDLITDTFALFVERSAAQMASFWAGIEESVAQMVSRLDGSEQARRQLADELAAMAVKYVQHQLRERRDHLIVEQAFQQEALLNPRLRDLVRAHRRILQQGVTHFFEVLGSRQPEQDAVLLTATIVRVEYQGLLDGPEQLDSEGMLAILKRYMNLVLGF